MKRELKYSPYCKFYFSHTGPVGGLVHRQLNTLRRLQQVSYLLLFCRRTVFNSQFILLSKEVQHVKAECL